MQFGRSSERLDPDQLPLALEDTDIAHIQESRPFVARPPTERPSHRKPLPDHLPREDALVDVDNTICTCSGGEMHAIGESVSEMLDWIPAQLRVIRTTRPKYACRVCQTVAQAPAPERPIAGGLATPALLAGADSQVLRSYPQFGGARDGRCVDEPTPSAYQPPTMKGSLQLHHYPSITEFRWASSVPLLQME
ncbi:IS66 family transposase zinc-finger binding domain-containing protein [Mesorhizobium sp. NPDC059024]